MEGRVTGISSRNEQSVGTRHQGTCIVPSAHEAGLRSDGPETGLEKLPNYRHHKSIVFDGVEDHVFPNCEY
jgi:hypothetical protein